MKHNLILTTPLAGVRHDASTAPSVYHRPAASFMRKGQP